MQKMIGKIATRYPMTIGLGFLIVILSFIVGWFSSQTAATYFAESKLIRETTLMSQRASFESVALWLPYFKFVGVGLILGGIVMALRVIIDSLKAAGTDVLSNLPPDQRIPMPEPPWYGKMMPMVMMLGQLIFIVAFVVSLGVAGMARSLFANPLPDIDAAGAGTALLNQIEAIHVASSWLVPFKFLGVATEFLAIVMGLATIIYILSMQTDILDRSLHMARNLVSATATNS